MLLRDGQRMHYRANESPNFPVTLLFAIQQLLVCASGLIVVPFLVADVACAGPDTALLRSQLCSATLFAAGIATLLQNVCGVRLALLQGPSFAFLPALYALSKSLPEFQCSDDTQHVHLPKSEYLNRMQKIQGSLMAASAVQMLIGFTGLIGLITEYVGPLTIAPLMLLLELSVVEVSVDHAQKHWISLLLMFLLVLMSFYLADIRVPIPVIRKWRLQTVWSPVFSLFPYLLAIGICWLVCFLLTVTDMEVEGGAARTDRNVTMAVVLQTPWVALPYPGRFGRPSFHIGICLGLVAATIASVIESVGDYHACARVSCERPPPSHAVNRGILIEGFGCLVAGALGIGVGVTTYSENIGVIGITKVGSRRVMEVTAILLIFLGIFAKFGAVLGTIPEPLVGGIFAISLAMVAGIGLSSVQTVNLQLSRNMGILGMAILFGMFIPTYFERHPVDTGIQQDLDQVLNILLTIRMLVGGIIGFVLDNTMPGATRADRGLTPKGGRISTAERIERDAYSLPMPWLRLLKRLPGSRFLPFLPPLNIHNIDPV